MKAPWLDSFRAIGLVLVLIYHFFPEVLPGGFVGVDIFFVISGFLVTSLLVEEFRQKDRIALGAFYKRRLKRLLPPLTIMVAFSLTASFLVSSEFRVGMKAQVAAVFGWVTNYYEVLLGGSYENQIFPHFFVHTWTLAVEMQYYIIWGILITVLLLVMTKHGHRIHRSFKKRNVIAAVALIIAIISYIHMQILQTGSPENPSIAYYSTGSSIYPLMLGSALGAAVGFVPKLAKSKIIAISGIGVSLAIICVIAFNITFVSVATYRWGILLVSVLTLFICYALCSLRECLPEKEIGLIKYLGVRSYIIYLYHKPVYIIISNIMTGPLGFHKNPPAVLSAVLAIAITVGLSELTFRVMDKELRKKLWHNVRSLFTVNLSGYPRDRRRAAVSILSIVLCVGLVAGSCVAVGTAPIRSAIEVDYEHENVMVNIGALGQTNAVLLSLSENPVLLHGHPEFVPMPPSIATPEIEAVRRAAIEAARIAAEEQAKRRSASVVLVGDSVSLGAAEAMVSAIPGIYVDAAVNRTMSQAYDIIMGLQASGELAEIVVVSCANNVNGNTIPYMDKIINDIADGHKLVFITAYGKDNMAEGSDYIRSLPERYKFVTVADWAATIAGNDGLLAADGIHIGGDAKTIFANCVADAVKKATKGKAK
ncbi:MAG: acyltransferase [Clostridiales Family XIII bacterium]|jgi:peptidoglycan/LPS O-acetylase OafA/YrhL|nr:acyltransferase [Clostridiales Family XIII bacterium]